MHSQLLILSRFPYISLSKLPCFLLHIFFMERNQMYSQVAHVRQSFFDQGYLDEQFIQLEELQDDTNPNFVEEIVTMYYKNSAGMINSIDQTLEKRPLDFSKLDNHMQKFMGSSASIGAKKVNAECTKFMEYCKARNTEGCTKTFQQLKREYATLRRKLEAYFHQARQVGPTATVAGPSNKSIKSNMEEEMTK